MRTPPMLLGAVLLFWGWQTGFPGVGAVMAAILEGARVIKARWEFTDDDFSRIWTVCSLLFLGAAVYAFTDNGGPGHFSTLFQHPTPAVQISAGTVTARTASAILRWLPMALFLFVAAQAYSSREEIPLTTISLILRRRWKNTKKYGRPSPAVHGMNVSYPYFAVCLFAASVHASDNNENITYFWGLCSLLAWALWSQRPRRFGVMIWAGSLATVFAFGFFGQNGIGHLQSYLQNLDPQWLARFVGHRGSDPTQSRTSLGQIGRLKTSGKIVIRLQTEGGNPPPPYLREASYRIFTSDVWQAGTPKDDFQSQGEDTPNSRTWTLQLKTNTTRVHIACYLDDRSDETGYRIGLLPLPTGSARLENLPAFVLKKNSLGAVLAEGPGLDVFDVLYGPGATIDAPFNTNEVFFTTHFGSFGWERRNRRFGTNAVFNGNPDLLVPLEEKPALDQVISKWRLPKGNPGQTVRAVRAFFESNFVYSIWQYRPRTRSTNETALARFLLRTHSGHCEYFATATVLLLRELGIPTRYAVGYAVHEASGRGYVVRLSDAHAWCLAWDEKTKTWQDFDTTPASWEEEEAKKFSPFQRLSDAWSWIQFQFSEVRWGQSNIRRYLLLALVPMLAALIYQIFFRQKRLRRHQAKSMEKRLVWPGLDSEFYLVERKLAACGIARRIDEPLSDWLRRVLKDRELAQAGDPLRDLLRLHYRYRFDPHGLTVVDREHLKSATRSVLEALNQKPVTF